jgi:hypothetical protein
MFASSVFRFQNYRHRAGEFFTPRKPRHRALRVLLALIGVAVLAGLLVVGVVVGAAMLGVGLLARLWRRRGKPIAAAPARPLEGEYRVVRKPMLSNAR